MKSRSQYYLIVIIVLAAILRIIFLSRENLWLDEGYTARRVADTIPGLIADLKHETQSASYYFIVRGWCKIFGISEFSMRFPSVIFGILSVIAIFLLAKKLFNANTAYWASFLLAINPFAIYYSQEARPYSQFLMVTVLSLYFSLLLMERWNRLRILGYLIFTTWTMYTQPLGPLILGVQAAMLLIYRSDESYPVARWHPWKLVGIACLPVILFIPQLYLQIHAIGDTLRGVGGASWIIKPPVDKPFRTFTAYFMFPGLAAIVGSLIIAGLWQGWKRSAGERRGWLAILMMLGAFMIVPWLESLVAVPVYVDRYTIPALAAVVLAAGWALFVLPRYFRVAFIAVISLISVYVLNHYYRYADKEPWRETAALVTQECRPGDALVLLETFTQYAFSRYYQPADGVDWIKPGYDGRIPAALDTSSRVVLVKAYTDVKTARVDTLLAHVARDRTLIKETNVSNMIHRNRWAYWFPDIYIRVYER